MRTRIRYSDIGGGAADRVIFLNYITFIKNIATLLNTSAKAQGYTRIWNKMKHE